MGPKYIIIEVTNDVRSLSSSHLIILNLVRFLRCMVRFGYWDYNKNSV